MSEYKRNVSRMIINRRETIIVSNKETIEPTMEFKLSFVALVVLSAGCLLPTPTCSQADDTALPLLPLLPRVLDATEQTCPPDDLRNTAHSELAQDIRTLLHDNVVCTVQMATPAASCSEISANCPSGYYWVRNSNGAAVQVYCDLDRRCGCSSTRGWVRVANFDASNTSQQCPSAWRLITTPKRTCGRARGDGGCDSAIFPTNGIRYSHVCGQVIGYQYATVDAFVNPSATTTLDSTYVDGVSITHGAVGSRQHIWSFVAGFGHATNTDVNCPCSGGSSPSSYVGQDYFCETGNDIREFPGVFYDGDPLWDGSNCGSAFACECTVNSPPWFCKELPQATTDDIEVRICGDEGRGNEDTPVELIELYIR